MTYMTAAETAYLELWKAISRNREKSTEPAEFRNVRMFVDLLESARQIAADKKNRHLKKSLAQQVRELESHLRNTFGLLYVQAPFMTDIGKRRAVADLKEKVRTVMPEYVAGLLPKDFNPEAPPETLPSTW